MTEVQTLERLAVESKAKVGTLIVVGLGIGPGDLTLDAARTISNSDIVFSLATNPVSESIVRDLNSNIRSLHVCYGADKPREQTYQDMVDLIMAEVRVGNSVCVALYGHPGVFADPTHAAIKRAREEGYAAVMRPGISAEDSLYADLGIDPGKFGCQSFEASDFLIRNKIWDPHSLLVLWQISVLGINCLPGSDKSLPGLELLKKKLVDVYGEGHKGTLYEAPCYALCQHRAVEKAIANLEAEDFRPETTFVIHPLPNDLRLNEEFLKVIR